VLPVRWCGRDLVLWRGTSGAVHATDAHCPHLGAHLGYGGLVTGESIRCPFHGWVIGADGRPLNSPPCEPIRVWPALEQDGEIQLYFDPDGRAPEWTPPALPPDVSRVHAHVWRFRSHVQEVVENLVDSAHFAAFHRTPQRVRHTFHPDGDHAHYETLPFAVSTLAAPVATRIVGQGAGLGQWYVRFEGVPTVTGVERVTPIDQELVELHTSYYASGDLEAARKFGRSIVLQIEQDVKIWTHKIYRPDPPLTPADGPIREFREWATRFY
jgi:nitrite reductase/ring-hydroxylating ferredoxin subunit